MLKVYLAVGFLLSGCLLCRPSFAEDSDPEVAMMVLHASLSKTEAAALTLKDALAIAAEENQNRQAALAQVQEAKARYMTRLAQFLPDFAIVQPFVNYEGTIQGPTGAAYKAKLASFQPQLVFRFNLLPKGAQLLQAKIAKRELEAQRESAQAVMQQTLKDTGLAYYELQRRIQDVAIARQFIEESETILEINQSRVEANNGTPLDVLQSESQLLDAQSQYVEAARSAEAAALRLNELLNLPAFSEVVPTEETLLTRSLIREDADFTAMLSRADQENPSLKAIGKQLESLTQLFKPTSIALAMMPQVYAQYRTGRTGTSLVDGDRFDERSYGIAFTYENMGISKITQYQDYRARIARLSHLLEAEKNKIERDLSVAWVTAKAKQTQLEVAKRRLAVNEETFKKAIDQLLAGQGRNLDVMTAQTNLNLVRQSLNTIIMEYNQAQIGLVYAMGLASVDTLTAGLPSEH